MSEIVNAICMRCMRGLPPEPGGKNGSVLPCAHVRNDGSHCSIGAGPRYSDPSPDEIWADDAWWDLPADPAPTFKIGPNVCKTCYGDSRGIQDREGRFVECHHCRGTHREDHHPRF